MEREYHGDVIELGVASIETRGEGGLILDEPVGQSLGGLSDE